MTPSLNRRALVAGVAATAVAVVPALSVTGDPDAELVTLAQHWRATREAEQRHYDGPWAAADAGRLTLQGDRPDVLRVRGADVMNGLAPPHKAAGWFTADDVDAVRAQRNTVRACLRRYPTPENNRQLERCNAVLAAIVVWERRCRQAAQLSGFAAADAEATRLGDVVYDLEERIIATPAQTVAGLKVKAEVGLALTHDDETRETHIALTTFRQIVEMA